jgi:ribosome-binding factor A
VSRRTERVGNLIREIIAEAIQNRLSDPRIPPITSITRIQVSEDFSVACVYVSVMAPEAQRRLCLAGLQSASGLLRRLLAPELRLRKVPWLDFRLDDSVRRSFEIVTAVDGAMRELGQPPEWEQDQEEPQRPSEQPEAADLPAGRPKGDRPPGPTRGAAEEDA